MPLDMDQAHAICVPCAWAAPVGLAAHAGMLVLCPRTGTSLFSALDSLSEPSLWAQSLDAPSQWMPAEPALWADASIFCSSQAA